MMRFPILLALAALPCLAPGSPAQIESGILEVGSKVPPLNCTDASGIPLSWEKWAERATMVFFHSQDMSFSKQALHDTCMALAKEEGLVDRFSILLVTNGVRDVAKLTTTLEKTKMSFAITIDEDREKFQPYHVVAFPTIYALDAKGVVIHIDKGYGPLLSAKVLAAVKHAAGIIDAQGYKEMVSPQAQAPRSKNLILVTRTIRMVRQLVAAGMLEEGRKTLLKVIPPDSKHAEGMALLAGILLRQENMEDAETWIGRLQKADPKSIELPCLNAGLAILQGKPDQAIGHLEKMPLKNLRASFLKARALELKGQFEEAAKLYRKALQSVLDKRT